MNHQTHKNFGKTAGGRRWWQILSQEANHVFGYRLRYGGVQDRMVVERQQRVGVGEKVAMEVMASDLEGSQQTEGY